MRFILYHLYTFFIDLYFPRYKRRLGKLYCKIGNTCLAIMDSHYDLTQEEKDHINEIGLEMVEDILKSIQARREAQAGGMENEKD